MRQETDPLAKDEAANLATSPERLEILSRDVDGQVRRAVAGNPNTPWQTLEVLAWEFPQEFLHNPRGPLQLLGGPEQISEDWVFWSMLLRVEQIPPHWWQWLTSRPGLCDLDAFRMHVQVAGETTHAYGAPQEGDQRDLIGLTRLVTCFYGSQAAKMKSGWQVPGDRRALGENVRGLAHQSADDLRRELVAPKQWIPEEMLQELARDKAWKMREAVAINKQTPPAVLEELARDNKNGRVRKAVAMNEQTPPAVLEELARDKYWVVCTAAAGNRQMPIATLRELARGADGLMREAVAKNPRTPSAVLEELARDRDANVRRAVVMNEQAPPAVLEELARDRDANMRSMAVNHLRLPSASRARLFHDPDPAVRHSVINEAPPFQFSRLGIGYVAEEASARYLARPDYPPIGLERLSHSRSWQVRYLVALHEGTPPEARRALSHDGNRYVRAAAWLTLREMEKKEE